MKLVSFLTFLACAVKLSLWSIDSSQFEEITGLRGTYNASEKTFKVSFPRDDIKVTVDGSVLDPFMGLTSWVTFIQMNDNNFMAMGDFVLFQDEVNPVLTSFLNNQVDVTALHNHFFYDHPKVYFMHIEGMGDLKALATSVEAALEVKRKIRQKNPQPSNGFGGFDVSTNAIELSELEKVFGIKGQAKAGMAKFVFGRSANVHNFKVGSEMGVNTWAAFGGTNDKAIVDGDFAVLSNELKPVLTTLRDGGINIVALHNHMSEETPRMFFLHYWGKGNASDLAKTIKLALSKTKA